MASDSVNASFELISAGLSSFSSRECIEEMALVNIRKDFFRVVSQAQQITCRKSELVSSGAHNLKGAENYLAENNYH